MTPEQIKELEEKAKLWDELSHVLHKLLNPIKQNKSVVFDYRPTPNYVSHGTSSSNPVISTSTDNSTTIENISNASSHIGLLEEESKEWCGYCCQEIKNAKV